MLKIKGFNEPSAKVRLPLSWDISNPLLPLRIQIEEDVSLLKQLIEHYKWDLRIDYKKILSLGFTIVVTNLQKEIIWVSSNFFYMTGYLPEEVKGRKPDFLQGARTSKKQVATISEKLQRYETIKASLINYKKDHEPYLCQIRIHPIKNTSGQITHFFAIEKKKDE